MMLGFFCLNFVIYFFITWFPSHLVQTRGFSLKSLGMIPALIAIPGGWLGGYVSDALFRRGWSLTAARNTCMVGGIQNFASNLAGIVITTFTGIIVALTKGSFTIPLVVAGGFCFLGAFNYLVIVGRIAPWSFESESSGVPGGASSPI